MIREKKENKTFLNFCNVYTEKESPRYKNMASNLVVGCPLNADNKLLSVWMDIMLTL